MQIYVEFEGFHLNSALFGSVIYLTPGGAAVQW